MALKHIVLELARSPGFPEGSSRHGYELIAPLDERGHIDRDEFGKFGQACTVRRFWGDDDDEHGQLEYGPDGEWRFSYAPGVEDDEPVFRLESHLFVVGEYVSITEHDGESRPFKVVRVDTPPALRR